ncbi:anti-sigma factor [Sediminibacterium sp.]|uniref:anti-sigma factor n=1 Tax=Sediminibacterium sp. TaxID=1917865 RepID=UPI002736DC8C|nr:anti-sigma factor [Sediminibacterium sp.]MDP3394807.1 anti-sigma factor [Sediminibacterium sp.]MDP3568642.1 anti-sigma factor [Sediminibacterium sp.]
MNTQEYIQSGIIESYVLGMASSAEVAELEQLCLQYPEIKKALNDFELALEANALSKAVTPPPQVKKQIFAALQSNFVENENKAAENTKALASPLNEMMVVKMNQPSRFLAAASIILLVISGGMNIYFYSKFKETTQQYQALVLEKNTLQANNQIMQTKSLDMFNSMQMMTDPNMQKVSMPGITGKEANYATVFWNLKSKDVYILPNKLPQPANGKQYQLWAIVDGKPVDAGVISDCAGLCKMKNIPSASMFAITLEKLGGSETPTLSEMYVAGKVG